MNYKYCFQIPQFTVPGSINKTMGSGRPMTRKVTAADVSAEIDLCTPYFRVDKLELAETTD